MGDITRPLVSIAIYAAALVLTGAADAADCDPADGLQDNCFIVNGQMETDTFNLPDPGDTLILQSGGEVNTAVGPGIAMGSAATDVSQIITIEAGGAVTATTGHGVHSVGDFATINNGGVIDAGDDGIFAEGFTPFINNSGGITAAVNGIRTTEDFAEIINTGAITAAGGTGILVEGETSTVVNSGSISGGGGNAIVFTDDFATLTLLAGTSLDGGIQFTNDVTNTLVLGPGLSAALTVGGIYALVTSGVYLIDGDQLVVVDATGFSAQDEMLLDLTGIIARAVGSRLEAARVGDSAQSAALSNGLAVVPVAQMHGRAAAWVGGLGSWRDERESAEDFELLQGGTVAGFDGALGATGRAGLFVGGALAEVEMQGNVQSLEAESWFGGLYASVGGQGGAFADVMLAGGVSRFDSARDIITSNAATERATAEFDGVFIAPTARIGTELEMYSGGIITPSLRARYAGLWLEGYSETGSSANLSVEDRSLHVFELRAELAVRGVVEREGGTLHNTLRVGAEGSAAEGGAVDATLIAMPLSFDPNDEDIAGRGFLGFDSRYTTLGGSSLSLGAEAGFDLDDNLTAKAEAGLYVPL